MSAALLFEHPHRGHVWRLEEASYKGRTFANWRKWCWVGDQLRPTREGCTIPLERLPELEAALRARRQAKGSFGLPSGS